MAKTTQSILMGLCFIFLLAISVSAAVTVSKTELLVDANYARFADEDQKTISEQTETFTLTNTGTEDAALSYTITGLPNGYSAETKSVTLAAGVASEALMLNVNVPHQQDSGKESIGTLTVTQAGTTVASVPVKQDTKPLLEFDRVEIEFTDEDGEVQTARFSETETAYNIDENILIGTPLKMTFKVRNLFDRDYDENSRDIQDIELSLNPSENDLFSEKNIDDEIYDIGTLDADENKEQEIILNIDSDADVDEYTVEITLEGEDGEGAKHTLERILKFELVRKRDDVRVTKAEVLPVTLSCGREITLDLELTNLGAREQVFAGLLIFNQELGIRKNVADLKLQDYGEEDNAWSSQFKFIIPSDARKGVHYLDVTAFVKRDVDTDSKRVPFTIAECVEEEEEENGAVDSPTGNVVANADDGEKENESNSEKEKDEEKDDDEIKSQFDVIKTVERISFNPTPDQLWVGALTVMMVLLVAMNALLITLFIKR